MQNSVGARVAIIKYGSLEAGLENSRVIWASGGSFQGASLTPGGH
jgi:hypothetical protein